MTSIGRKIREARIQRGMTQSDLSADLVTPSMISQIEGDKVKPAYPLMRALADRLGHPIEYFLQDLEDQHAVLARIELASYHLASGEPQRALDVLQRIEPPTPPGRAYEGYTLSLTDAHRLQGEFDQATDLVETLREYALRTQDYYLQFRVCRLAGLIEYDTRNLHGAMHEWETSVILGEHVVSTGQLPRVQFQSELSEVYQRLWQIHLELEQPIKADVALARAVQHADDFATLRALTQSWVQDGLVFLEQDQAASAEDLFHRAALMAQTVNLMAQSVRLRATQQRMLKQPPADPWTEVVTSVVGMNRERFLNAELASLDFLLGQNDVEGVEARLSTARAVWSRLPETGASSGVGPHPIEVRFDVIASQALHARGLVVEAVAAAESVMAKLREHGRLEEWLRTAAMVIRWKAEVADFDGVYQLTREMEQVYSQFRDTTANRLQSS